MTVQSDRSCCDDTQSCVSVPAQPEVVPSGTDVSRCHWRVTLSQASFRIHSASAGLVTMLSIGRPSSWQPVTDSSSSPPWASHGLLHKSISSFCSQISVPRFWMNFGFKPADHGAGGTRTFSWWLARGRACVGDTVKSPHPWRLTAESHVVQTWKSPSPCSPLPGCRKWGTRPATPRAIHQELRGSPGKGLDLGLTWLAQGDSQPHCSCKSGSVRERTNANDPQQACAWTLVAVWGARHPFPALSQVSSFNCMDIPAASDGLWETFNIAECWDLIWWPAHREVATLFVQQVPSLF